MKRPTKNLQSKLETEFKSELKEVEGRMARGHRELETSLEAEIRRNGTKLEDMEDRYARSEDALRRAEERIGEVQEEVNLSQLFPCSSFVFLRQDVGVVLRCLALTFHVASLTSHQVA